ncbi:MAG: ATP-binding protein [Cyanosarcina radialis HA8281-LM2]|jgi:DNA polymerase III delta prime subunit|nr:ATP-binding protein [Cyanosarcina radialis HA8281-LM2]
MSEKLLKSFQKAYSNLELSPLLQQNDLDRFRVNFGGEIVEQLEQLVEDSPNRDGKIVFTGHRGCGKSTLLAEFSRRLADRYFVVFFSISDTIEMSDVNHINILFAIAVNLMSEAEANQVKISKANRKAVYSWFSTKTRIEEEKFEAGLDFDLFGLLKLIKTKLKADAVVRYEIKQEFERKITDLVARINEIAALIQNKTKKEILVIIDDLDKLDLAVVNNIYKDNIKAICLPNFHIIYTIPIAVLRETVIKSTIENETNDQVVIMPVMKLFDKQQARVTNAQPRSQAADILCEILKKRIEPNLIESSTADKIVLNSGGLLRELIRIAKECCQICLLNIRRRPADKVIINDEILEKAIDNIRNDFALPLGKAEYIILQVVYQQFKPADPKEQKFLDLLHGLYVLEYRNRQNWYDVHPIVVELLKEEGLIHVS